MRISPKAAALSKMSHEGKTLTEAAASGIPALRDPKQELIKPSTFATS